MVLIFTMCFATLLGAPSQHHQGSGRDPKSEIESQSSLDATLRIEPAAVFMPEAGAAKEFLVQLTTRRARASGWAFGIKVDPDPGAAMAITRLAVPDELLRVKNETPADFIGFNWFHADDLQNEGAICETTCDGIQAAGFTQGVVIDLTQQVSLPVTAVFPVARLTASASGTEGQVARLVFTDELGNPQIRTAVVFDNGPVIPATKEPAVAHIAIDTDGDGLTDPEEDVVRCDPQDPDSDSDGVPDGQDNCPATSNPAQVDTDANGIGDACAGPPLVFRRKLRSFHLAAGEVHRVTLEIGNLDIRSHMLAGLASLSMQDDLALRFLEPGVTQAVRVNPRMATAATLVVDTTYVRPGTTYTTWVKCLTDGDPELADFTQLVFAVGSGKPLPDLEITSKDIQFDPEKGEPNEPSTIAATIHNRGSAPAAEVSVLFTDFGLPIESQVILLLNPGESIELTTQYDWSEPGYKLVTVTVDPDSDLRESNERNNVGAAIYRVDPPAGLAAQIVISCTAPSGYAEGMTGRIAGRASYSIPVDNELTYEYPVKGGTVSARTVYGDDIRVVSNVYTDHEGGFTTSFPVPGTAGETFLIAISVTDETLTGGWERTFDVLDPHPEPPDAWIYPEDIGFSPDNPGAGESVTIEAVVHASPANTEPLFDVPVTFYAHHLPSGTVEIGETHILAELQPGASHCVSRSWSRTAASLYCVTVELGPHFSDRLSGNNSASRVLPVGSLPERIQVAIEAPSEDEVVPASEATPVIVSVTSDVDAAMIPCLLETLTLRVSGADERTAPIKAHFDGDTLRYLYAWRPASRAQGQACLQVIARSMDIAGRILAASDTVCVEIADDAPPTFTIRAHPSRVLREHVVEITVDASEPLLNDEPTSIAVADSSGQGISLAPESPAHPWSTRWIYRTKPLSDDTAFGTAEVAVSGRDIRSNEGHGRGHFTVLDRIGDMEVYAHHILFSDCNPRPGDTVTIEAEIHASTGNPYALLDIPVVLLIHSPAEGILEPVQPPPISELPAGASAVVSTDWTPPHEGTYVVEVIIGLRDDDPTNSQATRALLVGTFFKRGDVNAKGDVDLADAICILVYLFGGPGSRCEEAIPRCHDAADANDDGSNDLGDALYILTWLFSDGPPPPDPGPFNCGPDPTPDDLGCMSYPPCESPGQSPCTVE